MKLLAHIYLFNLYNEAISSYIFIFMLAKWADTF